MKGERGQDCLGVLGVGEWMGVENGETGSITASPQIHGNAPVSAF